MANEIYNTSWWGNALDTARTAGTNPDFFGSQFKLLTSEQDNLVVNGDFATDSDWIKQAGWSIASGSANYNDSLGYRSISQSSLVSPVGKTYKVTYEVSNYLSGGVRCILGGFALGQVTSSNGIVTETITTSNASSNTFVYLETSGSGFVGSIDNVSVKLVRCELEDIEAKKCLADWIHTTALKDLNN